MHFNAIFPLKGWFTTEELNREIQRLFRKDGRLFCLKENREGLFWQGALLAPRIRHVYYPDPDMLIPEPKPETDDDIYSMPRERKEIKDIWVEYPYFFRSADTQWLWIATTSGRYVSPGKSSHIDTLFLQEDYAVLERYVVTNDPQAQDSGTEFTYYEAPDDTVMITGVKHYCERLRIPSRINNKPVVCARIPYSLKIRHLRELIVEDGVERLDFFWSIPELSSITIPSSTTLIHQPETIRFTQWFQNQSEGPVYLGGWYCGYKGPIPVDETLKIQDGTIGVISDCDDTVKWKRIILPDSLSFVGKFAFAVPRREIDVVCRQKALAAAFDPFYCAEQNDSVDNKTSVFSVENGKQLYDLCLNCAELKPFLREGAFPLPPRLRYKDNCWGADYLLIRKECSSYKPIVYCAAFDLCTGKLLNPPKKREQFFRNTGYWTENYLNPYYLLGVEYLNYCADMIRSDLVPDKRDLALLQSWWLRVIPEYIRRKLQTQ